MPKKSQAVGIDLGTTFSCVAVWAHGKIEIIPNNQGNRITPSYVAFTDTERLIGDAAKQQVALNPKNTAYDAKRLIGRTFDDPNVQDDMKLWSFRVVKHSDGRPKIELEYQYEQKSFYPEEISSMVLGCMKETAETYLGAEVTDAVITVPAYFNDAQREATKFAGVAAGLNVLRIINEPTAAAIAYGLDKKLKCSKIFIYDLGGGTFDVSVLDIKDMKFEVLATGGNTHLGGEDFDNRLVSFFMKEFKRKYKKDISDNAKALRRLRTACELAKRTLSSASEACVTVDSLFDGVDFNEKIRRARFEELCIDLFQKTLQTMEQVLIDAKVTKNDIDDVVLVGGSTRIPKIRKLVEDFFDGKTLNKSIHPDEAVAYGAAVHAAVLHGDQCDSIKNVVLEDVIPLSLGVERLGELMNVFVERNTKIPCRKMKTLTTVTDNQRTIAFPVYEGERGLTKDNHLLGTFELTGFPLVPAGVPNFDVTFDIDANGILNVTAVNTETGLSNQFVIQNSRGRSQAEIKQILEDAEKFREEDRKNQERIVARETLSNAIDRVKQKLQSIDDGEKPELKQTTVEFLKKCDELSEWIDANKLAEKEEYEYQMSELMEAFLEM